MKNLIRVSDGAGHGGKVETGSTTMRFDGRYVARTGDHVSCPQHPDVTPNVIEEGDSLLTDGGIPIARHGHRRHVGATSSQALSECLAHAGHQDLGA